MKKYRPVVLGILIVVTFVVFGNPFARADANWAVQESEFGGSFEVQDVSWTQETVDDVTVLNWNVEFENPTGYVYSGPRGIGVKFLMLDEEGSVTRTGEGFIETADPGEHVISGSIRTDQIPSAVRVRFID